MTGHEVTGHLLYRPTSSALRGMVRTRSKSMSRPRTRRLTGRLARWEAGVCDELWGQAEGR